MGFQVKRMRKVGGQKRRTGFSPSFFAHMAKKGSFSKHELYQIYCTNSINSSVMHHRGSEIDEILQGHRSQGPATKPPGQYEEEQNWGPFSLEIDFFPPLSLSSNI